MSQEAVASAMVANEVAKTEATVAGVGNVDKIREIIFGGQMKGYEARFARLEEALQREMADLRDSTRKRLDALEASLRQEMEALASQDKMERAERLEALERLSRDVKEQGETFARKLGDSDGRHSDAERVIRNDLAAKSSEISDDIQRRTQDLAALLDKRFRELGTAKTDRAALASLFTEVALRLQGDFDLPADG